MNNILDALIVGHFGIGYDYYNGQIIKTKTITRELEKKYGKNNIAIVDTHGGVSKLFSIIYKAVSLGRISKNIIIMPAQNGLRIIAPLLAISCDSKRIQYVVIGGWLPEYLHKHKFLIHILQSFGGIYVETYTMKKNLIHLGFTNVYVMPNCKDLNILSSEDVRDKYVLPYKYCTFSRVMKEKGIELAVDAINELNQEGYNCELDIYGQIENNQKKWFNILEKKFGTRIRYCGIVDPSDSTDVIKQYYALLFPTFYDGEGFAGTIIDAYAAGTPVIASDWHYNSELIENGKTGIIVKSKNKESLKEGIVNSQMIQDKWIDMQLNCLNKAIAYLPNNILNTLFNNLNP